MPRQLMSRKATAWLWRMFPVIVQSPARCESSSSGPSIRTFEPLGAVFRLDRARGDGPFAHRPLAGVNPDIGRIGIGEVEVILDVAPSDLQVADLAPCDLDSRVLAVTDVTADDIGLMQVHAVEIDSDRRTTAVINM